MNYNADELAGIDAMREFYNYSVSKYGNAFQYTSFNDFFAKVAKYPRILAEGMGLAIRSNEMSTSEVREAMQTLAKKGQGRIPATMNGWFDALKDQALNVSFIDAAAYTVKETASTVVQGAAQIGDAVLDTGKSLLAIGPLLVVAAIVYIGFYKTKEIAGTGGVTRLKLK